MIFEKINKLEINEILNLKNYIKNYKNLFFKKIVIFFHILDFINFTNKIISFEKTEKYTSVIFIRTKGYER